MIEFGAGGQIVQSEEPIAAGASAAEATHTEKQDENNGETAAAPEPTAEDAPAIPAVAPATGPRRKSKAKGWL